MPELGESVTEGTVTRWLKQVGDTVELDEPLLEVSTDKVDTEIPSPVAGTLLSITVDEDETVQVGAELAVVGDPAGQGRRLVGRTGAGRGGGAGSRAGGPEAGSPDAGSPEAGGSRSRRPRSRRPPSRRRTPSRSGPRPPTTRPPRAVTTVRRVPRT